MESLVSQDKTGYVVRDNNPHHLADKIAELLSKPYSRAETAAAARAAVAKFSWVNIAEEIAQQYEAVLRDCATR